MDPDLPPEGLAGGVALHSVAAPRHPDGDGLLVTRKPFTYWDFH